MNWVPETVDPELRFPIIRSCYAKRIVNSEFKANAESFLEATYHRFRCFRELSSYLTGNIENREGLRLDGSYKKSIAVKSLLFIGFSCKIR